MNKSNITQQQRWRRDGLHAAHASALWRNHLAGVPVPRPSKVSRCWAAFIGEYLGFSSVCVPFVPLLFISFLPRLSSSSTLTAGPAPYQLWIIDSTLPSRLLSDISSPTNFNKGYLPPTLLIQVQFCLQFSIQTTVSTCHRCKWATEKKKPLMFTSTRNKSGNWLGGAPEWDFFKHISNAQVMNGAGK